VLGKKKYARNEDLLDVIRCSIYKNPEKMTLHGTATSKFKKFKGHDAALSCITFTNV